MSPAVDILARRRPNHGENIFLVGPGGVGKSTLGKNLARLALYPLIDLDLEFCQRIAIIGPFIADHGYETYRAANLALAKQLAGAANQPTIFVTSSGFLAAPPQSDDYRDAQALVAGGYGVVLLPSLDIDVATQIVVDRQIARGFGFRRDDEICKFQKRFAVYRDQGDMRVVSKAEPDEIASAVASALAFPTG